MANIEVQTVLDRKAKKFGASPTSADFQQLVIDSINYVLDDLENRLGLSTTRIDSMSDDLGLDQQDYGSLVEFGVDWYIVDYGEWSIGNAADIGVKYEKKLRHAHMNYMKTLDLGVKFGSLD